MVWAVDITISGLTRPQAHALIRLTGPYVDPELAAVARRDVHHRTLTALEARGLAWSTATAAGPTEAGVAAVTEALRPLLTDRLARVQAAADASWLAQTVGIALVPEYGGWHVEVIHQPHGRRPAGAYGPYLTVLPARYHVR
ncbi:hypothetical protein FF36_05993 [Frankia torreyi]|nr:hypothetical protein FF36_05993 [Frankia torreyi]